VKHYRDPPPLEHDLRLGRSLDGYRQCPG